MESPGAKAYRSHLSEDLAFDLPSTLRKDNIGSIELSKSHDFTARPKGCDSSTLSSEILSVMDSFFSFGCATTNSWQIPLIFLPGIMAKRRFRPTVVGSNNCNI